MLVAKLIDVDTRRWDMKMVKEIFLEWESEKIFSMPLRYAQNEDSQF